MKLALIGKSIAHSRSPSLYRKLLGSEIKYDLLDVQRTENLPKLSELASQYDGISITSPYKIHYSDLVIIEDDVVKKLGAINTIGFFEGRPFGTNTDLLAVREILLATRARFPQLHLILLGSGVMSHVTKLIADELKLSLIQLSRKTGGDLSSLDLAPFEKKTAQNLVINACSREFIFQGKQSRTNIFWDYNYDFMPHQNTLPFSVKEYHDGQEMLIKQAQAAIHFWQTTNPKLKC